MIAAYFADAAVRASILNLLPEFATTVVRRSVTGIIVRCFTARPQDLQGRFTCKTPRVAEEKGCHGAYIATGLLTQDLDGRPNLVGIMGEENTGTRNARTVAANTGLICGTLYVKDVVRVSTIKSFTRKAPACNWLGCFTVSPVAPLLGRGCFTGLLNTSNCGTRSPRYGRASDSHRERQFILSL